LGDERLAEGEERASERRGDSTTRDGRSINISIYQYINISINEQADDEHEGKRSSEAKNRGSSKHDKAVVLCGERETKSFPLALGGSYPSQTKKQRQEDKLPSARCPVTSVRLSVICGRRDAA
jgi:hypothetical protein